MSPEEIVAKYQKRVDEIHKGTDNRITHAWVEGEARSEMVLDISAAILDAVRAERERCAKTAETLTVQRPSGGVGAGTSLEIANAIRES